ncbi:MAG: bifunctional hydroxymethylpyrimidine kinase/phosphomethylpyrimidine kinase [Blastocatellia bacterium]|nr:bifunctional hydroxymethylpyrimidine kinase/phosphomethylpyrimidine kinase [Blastocatellia bacterium]
MKSILTIAGLDPAGGAGILADLKTIAAHGNHGVAVLTATTAQNTVGVKSFFPLTPEAVCQQLDALHEDIPLAAAKTGMVGTGEIAEAVCDWLHRHWLTPLVVDPVLVASSGHLLFEPEAIDTMRKKLLPLATIITPNLPEAATLTGRTVETQSQMEEAALRLYDLGPKYILVKGGHLSESATDLLYDGKTFQWFEGTRLEVNTHGTGCTMSAAIATLMGSGYEAPEAVARAKAFVRTAMGRMLKVGKGKMLLGHLPLDDLRQKVMELKGDDT